MSRFIESPIPKHYETIIQQLDQMGIPPLDTKEYELQTRKAISRSLIEGAIATGTQSPPSHAMTLIKFAREERSFKWAKINKDFLSEQAGNPSNEQLKTHYENNNIKTIGSMGEPLANEVGQWFVKTFLKIGKPIINTYFQTETGGIICSHKHNEKIKKRNYSSVGLPISSKIKIDQLNRKKKEFKIIKPWPGMMKRVLNGAHVYKKYFDKKGKFRLFDLATKRKNQIFIGWFWKR